MMKLISRICVSVMTILFLTIMLSLPRYAVPWSPPGLGSSELEPDTVLLLAHHVGNRPGWAQDVDDNVHGGDPDNWPDDPNDDSGPDEDQGGRPDDNGRPDDDSDGDQDDEATS